MFSHKTIELLMNLVVLLATLISLTIQNSGGSFSGQIKGALNSIKPGATVIFKDIVAEGPDGRQKVLNGITFIAR